MMELNTQTQMTTIARSTYSPTFNFNDENWKS